MRKHTKTFDAAEKEVAGKSVASCQSSRRGKQCVLGRYEQGKTRFC